MEDDSNNELDPKIAQGPVTSPNPSQLTTLDLSFNSIAEIPKNAFEDVLHLEEIRLNNNLITTIDPTDFNCLKKLKTLILSENLIVEIKNGHFKLESLEQLFISENSINEIQEDTFVQLHKLKHLDLSFNSLGEGDKMLKLNLNTPRLTVNIDLSSNELNRIPVIGLGKKSIGMSLNLRFNKIEDAFEHNQYIDNNRSQQIQIDIRENPCFERQFRKIENEKCFAAKKKPETKFIEEIEFKDFRDWKFNWTNISKFSLITGVNGIGKSSVLHYIYENLKTFDKEKSKFRCTYGFPQPFLIPVQYRMHDEIVSKIDEKMNVKDMVEDFKRRNEKKSGVEYNDYTLTKAINVFSSPSIEKLIIQFKNKLKYLNEHIKAKKFKYEIKIEPNPNEDEEDEIKLELNETTRIGLKDASPGEQLKLMFFIWEFSLQRFDILHTPVLLLDEPDAHLHPQGVKEFVEILEKLADAGAQIIMTSHNPTTVSFMRTENLFRMREEEEEETRNVRIDYPKSKVNIISALTSNAVMVNVPYRVVFVEGHVSGIDLNEPRYHNHQNDAFFYHRVMEIYSRIGYKFAYQLVFKSYKGFQDILDMIGKFNSAKLFRDHFAIIDNDNFFATRRVFDPERAEKYYANRKVFNLVRHSIENYALDPINLFVYLNFLHNRHQNELDHDKYNTFLAK